MKRITIVFGVVAVMVAMLVVLAAPAMARTNGVNEERGESARVQANEERGFNHNFFNPAFNTGGLFISDGNVGFNTLGTGFGTGFTTLGTGFGTLGGVIL